MFRCLLTQIANQAAIQCKSACGRGEGDEHLCMHKTPPTRPLALVPEEEMFMLDARSAPFLALSSAKSYVTGL